MGDDHDDGRAFPCSPETTPRRGRPRPPPPPPPRPTFAAASARRGCHSSQTVPIEAAAATAVAQREESIPSRPPGRDLFLRRDTQLRMQPGRARSVYPALARRRRSAMVRWHYLLPLAILLCLPIPSETYTFLGGVPEAARELEAHGRFNQLVTQMQVDIAARDAAGFVEVDHGAGAGSGILRWAVGSVFAVFWVALIIGLVGGEKDPVPAVRAVTRSPHDITHLGLYLAGALRT
nr:uncharacterized protein LOC4347549 isoform X1 [Oryza sativa Japonica Group]